MRNQHEYARHPNPWQQFNLRDMFYFLVAFGLYFAVVTSAWRTFATRWRHPDHFEQNWWAVAATVAVAWIVLWLLYRGWGLRHALIIHYAGPVIGCVFVFLLLPNALGSARLDRFFIGVAALVLCGCGMSVLVSLPASILMWLYLTIRPVSNSRRSLQRHNG